MSPPPSGMDNNSKSGENEIIREFDDILVHVNGWGFYQWMLLLYTCGITMIVSYAQNASVLMLYEPPQFRCTKPPFGNGLRVEEEMAAVACNFNGDMAKKCCMPIRQVRRSQCPT